MQLRALDSFDGAASSVQNVFLQDLTRQSIEHLRTVVNGLLNGGGGNVLVGVQENMLVTGVRVSGAQLETLRYALTLYAQNSSPAVSGGRVVVRLFHVHDAQAAEASLGGHARPSAGGRAKGTPKRPDEDLVAVQIAVQPGSCRHVVYVNAAQAEAYVCAGQHTHRLSAPQVLERAACCRPADYAAIVARQRDVQLLAQQNGALEEIVRFDCEPGGLGAQIIVVEGGRCSGKSFLGGLAFQRLRYAVKIEVDMRGALVGDVYLRIIQTLEPNFVCGFAPDHLRLEGADSPTAGTALGGVRGAVEKRCLELRNVCFNLLNRQEAPVLIYFNGAAGRIGDLVNSDARATYLVTTHDAGVLGLEEVPECRCKVLKIAQMTEAQVTAILVGSGVPRTEAAAEAAAAASGQAPRLHDLMCRACVLSWEACRGVAGRADETLLGALQVVSGNVSFQHVHAILVELLGEAGAIQEGLGPVGRLLGRGAVRLTDSGYALYAMGTCTPESRQRCIAAVVDSFTALVRQLWAPADVESVADCAEDEDSAEEYVIQCDSQTRFEANGYQVLELREAARARRDFCTTNRDAAAFVMVQAGGAAGPAQDALRTAGLLPRAAGG